MDKKDYLYILIVVALVATVFFVLNKKQTEKQVLQQRTYDSLTNEIKIRHDSLRIYETQYKNLDAANDSLTAKILFNNETTNQNTTILYKRIRIKDSVYRSSDVLQLQRQFAERFGY